MGTPIKILYIDDEPLNRIVFERSFKKEFEVVAVSVIKEAFRLLNEDPSITHVISDMKMPEMNGIEFITKAKQTFDDKIYMILSAFTRNEEIADALEQGVIVSFFQKPYDREELSIAIKNTVEA
jgi:response regulator RpfG family c-di-GMP phosphodiesterase